MNKQLKQNKRKIEYLSRVLQSVITRNNTHAFFQLKTMQPSEKSHLHLTQYERTQIWSKLSSQKADHIKILKRCASRWIANTMDNQVRQAFLKWSEKATQHA
jgi:hypothetical protein